MYNSLVTILISPLITFNFDISLVDKYFPQLKNARNKRLRYPSLARWWITKIIPYDYFWYIDTDVLFNANIRDEFLKYQEGKLFFGFNRKLYNVTRDITSEIFIEGIYLNLEELNAGILFINAKQFNDMNLFDIILKYYKENAKYIRFVNQTGTTHMFTKKTGEELALALHSVKADNKKKWTEYVIYRIDVSKLKENIRFSYNLLMHKFSMNMNYLMFEFHVN